MIDAGTYRSPCIIVGRHTALLPSSSPSCRGHPRFDEERGCPGRRSAQLRLRGILRAPHPPLHSLAALLPTTAFVFSSLLYRSRTFRCLFSCPSLRYHYLILRAIRPIILPSREFCWGSFIVCPLPYRVLFIILCVVMNTISSLPIALSCSPSACRLRPLYCLPLPSDPLMLSIHHTVVPGFIPLLRFFFLSIIPSSYSLSMSAPL